MTDLIQIENRSRRSLLFLGPYTVFKVSYYYLKMFVSGFGVTRFTNKTQQCLQVVVKAAKGSARAAPSATGRFLAITSRVLRSLPFDVSLVVVV